MLFPLPGMLKLFFRSNPDTHFGAQFSYSFFNNDISPIGINLMPRLIPQTLSLFYIIYTAWFWHLENQESSLARSAVLRVIIMSFILSHCDVNASSPQNLISSIFSYFPLGYLAAWNNNHISKSKCGHITKSIWVLT